MALWYVTGGLTVRFISGMTMTPHPVFYLLMFNQKLLTVMCSVLQTTKEMVLYIIRIYKDHSIISYKTVPLQ